MHTTQHDDLRRPITLRLEQHRVHVDGDLHARGGRLHRLRATDFTTGGSYRGVIRHVLRLEGRNTKPCARKDAAQRSVFIGQMQLAGIQRRADTAVRRNMAAPVQAVGHRDLRVAYANRDVVKALGAQWDKTRKVWYVPSGMDLEAFREWLVE